MTITLERTGTAKLPFPRLRECCRLVQNEVEIKSWKRILTNLFLAYLVVYELPSSLLVKAVCTNLGRAAF